MIVEYSTELSFLLSGLMISVDVTVSLAGSQRSRCCCGEAQDADGLCWSLDLCWAAGQAEPKTHTFLKFLCLFALKMSDLELNMVQCCFWQLMKEQSYSEKHECSVQPTSLSTYEIFIHFLNVDSKDSFL